MKDLSFEIELRWSGTGREGAGEMTDDVALELSAPELVDGRGAGNPEELLVCAVSPRYTATLFGVLRRAKPPADSVAVSEKGTPDRRFRAYAVCGQPTILGGGPARQRAYEAAADVAHDRCFIGHTLVPEVNHEVGSVQVRDGAACAKNFQIKTSSSPQASSWRAPSRPRRLERDANAFTRRCSVSSTAAAVARRSAPTRTIGR